MGAILNDWKTQGIERVSSGIPLISRRVSTKRVPGDQRRGGDRPNLAAGKSNNPVRGVRSGSVQSRPKESDGIRSRSERFASRLGTDSGGWVLPEVVKANVDVKVDVLDLKRRSANVLAGLRIKSIKQLLSVPKVKLLQTPQFGPRSMADVEGKVFQYLAGNWPIQDHGRGRLDISALCKRAFVGHMLSILPERQQRILAARYGFWDGKIQTLANIGSQLGLSRERVRQIEARELRRLGRVFGSLRLRFELARSFHSKKHWRCSFCKKCGGAEKQNQQ